MEKLIYLLWTESGRLDREGSATMLGPVADALLALEPAGLSMNLADEDAATVALPLPPPPEDPAPAALVAIWLDNHDDRGPYETALTTATPGLTHWAAYLVTESLPTDYGANPWSALRDWADGERSRGVVVLTLMEKPDRLDDAAWYQHWYGVQTPMSTEIQPRTRYVRNAVARALTPDAPPYRGIVEEAWPSAEHVNDPMRFYCADDEATLNANLATMMDSVTAFLDLDRIRLASMSEYFLKTP